MGRYLPVLLFVVAGLTGWLVVLLMPGGGDDGADDPEPEAALAAPPIRLSKAKPAADPPAKPAAVEPETVAEGASPPSGDPMEMTKEQRAEMLQSMLKTPPHMLKSTRAEQRKYFEHMLENQQSVVQRFQERVLDFEGRSDLTELEVQELERTRFNVVMFEESIEMLEDHLDNWEDEP